MKHFLPSSVMLTPFLVKNYDAFVGDQSEPKTEQEMVSGDESKQEAIDIEETKS
ncbi:MULTISPECIES: hypothetical protein [Vibrio]|uniref:hypothetical protein n=1 Tax=Vibrio TaxID=662 RepID=UPI001EFD2EC3|nr:MULTISPECIES: hypothetical protein [Vibrio]MCG9630426.1 hypothetical protein [Vibrio sp. Isolate30]